MNYFKRIFILIIVVFISTTGCKKNEANKTNVISKSSTNEFASLKNYGRGKLSDAEYGNINWAKFDSSVLKNGDVVYSFGAEKNKNISFIFLITGDKVIGKMITLKLENSILNTAVYNMETGLNYTRNDNLNQASGTGPSNRTGDPSTLPPVVVVHYINSNSTVNFNLSIQFSGGGSGYDWNYVAETGYIANDEPVFDPPIEDNNNAPVLEFVDVNEALAFFAWEQSLSAEELAVLAQYPWAAVSIYRDAQKALAKAEEWAAAHPGVGNGITDGRADAIRHAYWNALMTSDVGANVALLFSTAHELGSTKPPTMSQSLYNLEREMDLHNNSAGSNFASANNYGSFTSAEAIWYDLTNGVGSLGLKYICAAGGPGSETLKDYYATCP
jgi:hypothetical protein